MADRRLTASRWHIKPSFLNSDLYRSFKNPVMIEASGKIGHRCSDISMFTKKQKITVLASTRLPWSNGYVGTQRIRHRHYLTRQPIWYTPKDVKPSMEWFLFIRMGIHHPDTYIVVCAWESHTQGPCGRLHWYWGSIYKNRELHQLGCLIEAICRCMVWLHFAYNLNIGIRNLQLARFVSI